MLIRRLLSPVTSTLSPTWSYPFSRRRGLEDKIKAKQTQKAVQQSDPNPNNNNNQQLEGASSALLQLSKLKVMNMQFFPVTLMISPTILSCETFYDPTFLLGTILTEKYCALALFLNVDLSQCILFLIIARRLSIITMLSLVTALHTLTGYYSLLTPLGMAMMTIMLPFRFCQFKQRYTEMQTKRLNTMTHIRVIYFFIFALLTTIKALHYEEVYSMEKKLGQMDEENKSRTVETL